MGDVVERLQDNIPMKLDIEYNADLYEVTTFTDYVDSDGEDIVREDKPHHFFRTRPELFAFLDKLVTEHVTADVKTP